MHTFPRSVYSMSNVSSPFFPCYLSSLPPFHFISFILFCAFSTSLQVVWYGSTRVAGSHTIHPLYVFPIASPQLCLLRVVDNLEAQASRDSANSANYLPRHAQAAPGLDRKRNHASRRGILIAASTPRAAAITELEKKILPGKRKYHTILQFEILLQAVNWGSRHSSFIPFCLDFRDMSLTVTLSFCTPVC